MAAIDTKSPSHNRALRMSQKSSLSWTRIACLTVTLTYLQPLVTEAFDLRRSQCHHHYIHRQQMQSAHSELKMDSQSSLNVSIKPLFSERQEVGEWKEGSQDCESQDCSVLPPSFSSIPSLYGELGRPLDDSDAVGDAYCEIRNTIGADGILPVPRPAAGASIPVEHRQSIAARVLSWVLKRIVSAWTSNTKGLDVHVTGASNQDIISGKIGNVEMKFDELTFGNIIVSGGGRLVLQGAELHMGRLFFQNRLQTYKRPYRLYSDFLLTQSDIINSKLIRGLLQSLVNTILEQVLNEAKGALRVQVKKVTMRACKLHVHGAVGIGIGDGSIGFEVALGANIRPGGQILSVRDIDVTLNPDTIFRSQYAVPLSQPIDVDLGRDCRIETLVIGKRSVWVQAVSIIKPLETIEASELAASAPMLPPPAEEVTHGRESNTRIVFDPRRAIQAAARRGRGWRTPDKDKDKDKEKDKDKDKDKERRASYLLDLGAVISGIMRLNGGLVIRWLLGPFGTIIGDKLS